MKYRLVRDTSAPSAAPRAGSEPVDGGRSLADSSLADMPVAILTGNDRIQFICSGYPSRPGTFPPAVRSDLLPCRSEAGIEAYTCMRTNISN